MSSSLEFSFADRRFKPPTQARAARLKKFAREQLIVDYLNRGVSVAEIAARIGVGEKRMRAVIRDIFARRMPHPPGEFVAIQVSRLNEALLVAFSAMSPPTSRRSPRWSKSCASSTATAAPSPPNGRGPRRRGSMRPPRRTRRSRGLARWRAGGAGA